MSFHAGSGPPPMPSFNSPAPGSTSSDDYYAQYYNQYYQYYYYNLYNQGGSNGQPTIDDRTTNLFVNYLAPSVTTEMLASLFSPYGEIESCKVLINLDTGTSKGFGFVKYTALDAARTALREMNGREVEGKSIQVRVAQSQAESKRKAPSSSSSHGVRYSPYATQPTAVPPPPPPSYAYPPFAYPPMYAPHGAYPPSSRERSLPQPGGRTSLDPANLYVNNLAEDTTDDMLLALFQPFGPVTSAKAIKDADTQKCKGYGFVRMNSAAEAAAAIKALHGTSPQFATKPLYVAHKSVKAM